VHLFGTLELPATGSRDEAYEHILPLAEEYGYQIGRHGKHGLVVANPYARSGYTVTYDRTGQQLADITRFPQEAMELLPGEIRAALPPLYHNEKQGLKAVAPVKFFTPDAGGRGMPPNSTATTCSSAWCRAWRSSWAILR
jgi:hypothetical protein